MSADAAREVWLLMSDLVLDNRRQREVTEATGLSFGKTRAVRRLSRRAMSMREFAAEMGIEAPNATVMVDDLESAGLVARRPHPTDRRRKIVQITGPGEELLAGLDQLVFAADDELLAGLSADERATLVRLLQRILPPDS